MNALTPTPASRPVRPTAPALSPALQQLLDSDGSPDEAAKTIAGNLTIREEARAALPALKAMAEHPAGEEGVFAVVSRRFASLGKPNLSEEEWRNWWADYYDACADLPLASLEAGMRAWVSNPDAQFIPKAGHLRHLAEAAPSQTLRRYHRAKRALQIADGGAPSTTDAPRIADPNQAAAIRKMRDECLASLKAAPNPLRGRQVEMLSTAGKPDEGGLTKEMRALMARRAEVGRA